MTLIFDLEFQGPSMFPLVDYVGVQVKINLINQQFVTFCDVSAVAL